MNKKLTVIDGNSLLFRAYFATAYPGVEIMHNSAGVPTNAIFAFSNMITKILSALRPEESIIVAFDKDKNTFRKQQLESYKANRKPTPEDLVTQFPIAREFLKALGIFQFEESGYEADDIAGTVAKKAALEGYEVVIYTSDKDYLQLVDSHITVNLIRKGLSDISVMTPESVKETFGFEPIQIIDYKGLRGDPSDNLPGIPGVGDKTAVKLIQDYGDFESIVRASETMTSKVGQSIWNNQADGRLCRDLARIRLDTPIDFSIEDTRYKGYDFVTVNQFAQKYELRQFLNKIPEKWKAVNPLEEKTEVTEVHSFEGIAFPERIGIAVDMESDDYYNSEIYGLAVSFGQENYYITLEDALKDSEFLRILKDGNIRKCGYFFKAAEVALLKRGIELGGQSFDLLLAAYLIDASIATANIANVMAVFGVDISTASPDTVSLFDSPKQVNATAKTAQASYYLEEKVRKELADRGALELYDHIEMPLSDVLARMEIEGFPLDAGILDRFGDEFKSREKELEEEIYAVAGEKFNISSTKQLADILYNKLGLWNPRGGSTSAEALRMIQNAHPIVPLITEYRKYSKLISTYIEGLKPHIHEDGKIHASFNQAQTSTGRLSSSNPNLQNISVRDEEGKLIRKAFHYPEEDIEILSLDYSQIELRVLASLSGCEGLRKIFLSGKDIHSETAKMIFNLQEEPTPLQRRRAKTVNFGIVYGISDWGLSEQLGISPKEANEIITSFYGSFPEISVFFRNIIESAVKDGYVSTLMGRRRYLRELHDANYQVREFAKRAAMNAPIQGTAADLIKVAMIQVDKALKEGGFRTKMVLQIHDELIFAVVKEEKERVYNLVKDIMEHAMKLEVPLLVDGGFGRDWYDAK